MIVYLIYILIIIVTLGLNRIGQQKFQHRWNLNLGYGIPALIMGIFLFLCSHPFFILSDFNKAYYPVGKLILENPASIYSNKCSNAGFVNLPILAILFIPFSFLNLTIAQILITILGLLSIALTCYVLVNYQEITGRNKLLLLGVFAISGPLFYSLRQGNSTHFVLLLLLTSLICLENKREFWGGILLAISALIKLPLFLFGVYFFLRGRWQIFLGMSVATVAIVGTSLLLFGIDLHQVWLQQCVQHNVGNPVAAYNVQSLDGFLARLLTDNNFFNWEPLKVGWQFKVVRYLLLSLLVGGAIWICWRSKPPITLEEQNLEFSIVLCLAVLISPISWTHYYLFLLLPLSLYLGKRLAVPLERPWFNWVMLSVMLMSLPVKRFQFDDPVLMFLIFKILISHYFYGGVLLLGILLAARWHSFKHHQLSEDNK